MWCNSHLLLACVSLSDCRVCECAEMVLPCEYILKPDDSCSQEPKVQESLPCCNNDSLPVSAASTCYCDMTAEATMQTHRHNLYSTLR